MDRPNYRKRHAPKNVDDIRQPLNVAISMDILRLSDFQEIDFSYKIKFLINVQWLDARIMFQNLDNNTFKNIIGNKKKKMLWIPPLVFNNSEKTTMFTMERPLDQPTVNIFVAKDSKGRVAGPTYLDEAYLYKGSENPLIVRTEYNLKMHCIYDLGYYPFDYQSCEMQV